MYIWAWWGEGYTCHEAKNKRFLETSANGVSGRRAGGVTGSSGLALEGFRVDNYQPCRAWGGRHVSACLKSLPCWQSIEMSLSRLTCSQFPLLQVLHWQSLQAPVQCPRTEPEERGASEVGWPNILASQHSPPSPQVRPTPCRSNSFTSHYSTIPHPQWEGHLHFRAILTRNGITLPYVFEAAVICFPPTLLHSSRLNRYS